MKEFNFVELLGDIRYDETGRIIGKESLAIKYLSFLFSWTWKLNKNSS